MRATFMYGAGDVRVENTADPVLRNPTDAIVRVVNSCICGSDLHPYHHSPADGTGTSMGHEFIGIVEETGAAVRTLAKGDFVIAPFAWSCGTCDFCREGLQTSCSNGGFWNSGDVAGGQAEAVRVPLADGTLVKVPGYTPSGPEDALLPSLLTLSDVLGTGHQAARSAGVGPRTTVTVVGDGAVGLMAVLSAKRLGAEQIILMGRHKDRTDLGREFGATDVVAERGAEGIERVRELTGGTISRVGVPQYEEAPVGFGSLFGHNITLTGGPAPVRAYIEEFRPEVLSGSINPGKVFDQTISLEDAASGYRAMDSRSALKVLIRG